MITISDAILAINPEAEFDYDDIDNVHTHGLDLGEIQSELSVRTIVIISQLGSGWLAWFWLVRLVPVGLPGPCWFPWLSGCRCPVFVTKTVAFVRLRIVENGS